MIRRSSRAKTTMTCSCQSQPLTLHLGRRSMSLEVDLLPIRRNSLRYRRKSTLSLLTAALWRRMGRFCPLRPRCSPRKTLLSENGAGKMQFGWRRRRREKELLNQIIEEAAEYKIDFYMRRKINCDTNKATTREKEKLFLTSQEKFHADADKNYWKTIAELIPNEVPSMEKKRGEKVQEKPSTVVIRGPKPGKPTDLSRMRQILVKLKHNTPPHLKPSPPPAPATAKDAKTAAAVAATTAPPKAAAVATTPEAVAVA